MGRLDGFNDNYVRQVFRSAFREIYSRHSSLAPFREAGYRLGPRQLTQPEVKLHRRLYSELHHSGSPKDKLRPFGAVRPVLAARTRIRLGEKLRSAVRRLPDLKPYEAIIGTASVIFSGDCQNRMGSIKSQAFRVRHERFHRISSAVSEGLTLLCLRKYGTVQISLEKLYAAIPTALPAIRR